MSFCRSLIFVLGIAVASLAHGQTPQLAPVIEQTGWRTPDDASSGGAKLEPVRTAQRESRASIAKVTKGSGVLPNDHGQVWREYDISPYTLRVSSTNRPEQAIVDWILRETGYEAWHSEPLGLLSATKRTLRVYHVPEIQAVVSEIVDRFVSSEAETEAFGLRVVTIGSPNWRAKALQLMKPVPVQSQGVQGWLLAKEDAALLLADLSRRNDFREHSSPHLLVNNGQSIVVSTLRQRSYMRGVSLTANAWPGYEPEIGALEEGFALEFSPLLALNRTTVDAIIKLRLNQIERMVPVMLDVPTAAGPRQRTRVEVPQVTMSNLHERFRWPTDQVLLLSMGVVATPAPTKGSNPLAQVLPLPKSPSRADALLFVESRGRLAARAPQQPVATGTAPVTPRAASRFPARY